MEVHERESIIFVCTLFSRLLAIADRDRHKAIEEGSKDLSFMYECVQTIDMCNKALDFLNKYLKNQEVIIDNRQLTLFEDHND